MSEETKEQNTAQQEVAQQTESHVGYWKSKDYGDIAISEMSDEYLQKAYYRSVGKISHHEKELKKQQDLHKFWTDKSAEVEEELKKRNLSLDTFLNVNTEGEEPMNVVGQQKEE